METRRHRTSKQKAGPSSPRQRRQSAAQGVGGESSVIEEEPPSPARAIARAFERSRERLLSTRDPSSDLSAQPGSRCSSLQPSPVSSQQRKARRSLDVYAEDDVPVDDGERAVPNALETPSPAPPRAAALFSADESEIQVSSGSPSPLKTAGLTQHVVDTMAANLKHLSTPRTPSAPAPEEARSRAPSDLEEDEEAPGEAKEPPAESKKAPPSVEFKAPSSPASKREKKSSAANDEDWRVPYSRQLNAPRWESTHYRQQTQPVLLKSQKDPSDLVEAENERTAALSAAAVIKRRETQREEGSGAVGSPVRPPPSSRRKSSPITREGPDSATKANLTPSSPRKAGLDLAALEAPGNGSQPQESKDRGPPESQIEIIDRTGQSQPAADEEDEDDSLVTVSQKRLQRQQRAPAPQMPQDEIGLKKAEAYFEQLKTGIKTSNNTLAGTPLLSRKNLASRAQYPALILAQELAAIGRTIPQRNAKERLALANKYRGRFPSWLAELCAGFNLLFYGYGSKKALLDEFGKAVLRKAGPVLVVNGYFPGTTLKQILTTISTEMFQLTSAPADPNEHLQAIARAFEPDSVRRLHIIFHDLDGPSLRNAKTQVILSQLAALPKIRLIASIDHLLTPYTWDSVMLQHFNWIWNHLPTYEPYVVEAVYEAPPVGGERDSLNMNSGVLTVLKSLTNDAKHMFLHLAQRQLEDPKNKRGVPLRTFEKECIENFWCSNSSGLNATMREFFEHKIVTQKRPEKGGEWYLRIPMDNSTLVQLVAQVTELVKDDDND